MRSFKDRRFKSVVMSQNVLELQKGRKTFSSTKKESFFLENYSFSIRSTLLEFNSGWFYPVLKNFEAALKRSS